MKAPRNSKNETPTKTTLTIQYIFAFGYFSNISSMPLQYRSSFGQIIIKSLPRLNCQSSQKYYNGRLNLKKIHEFPYYTYIVCHTAVCVVRALRWIEGLINLRQSVTAVIFLYFLQFLTLLLTLLPLLLLLLLIITQ